MSGTERVTIPLGGRDVYILPTVAIVNVVFVLVVTVPLITEDECFTERDRLLGTQVTRISRRLQ